MSKKDKRDKKRDKNRNKRKMQGEQLEKRIKEGQDRKAFKIRILKEDVDVKSWTPDNGRHTVDIIPYFAGSNDPNADEDTAQYTFNYFVHRQVGVQNKWYICPTMYKKPCPICEYRDKLRMKNDKRYKKYFPKARNLYNVWVQDDKQEIKNGIQIWDVSYHYFEKHLMEISKKPPRGGNEEKIVNFAHPQKGHSVIFKVAPPEGENDYPKYLGHQLDKRDYEIDDDILEQTKVLDELVELADYDEIKEEFFGDEDEPIESSSDDDNDDNDNQNNNDPEDLLEELEDDVEDEDDLEEFLSDHDIDEDDVKGYDEDNSFKKNLKIVKKHIEAMNKKSGSSSKYTRDDIEDMSKKELKKLIKKEDLTVDIDDYDKDDPDDFIDEICEELEIADDDIPY